jgi:hypothetical protein
MADRAKFLDFLDMIDGGGAGQMGGEFQGGGILSEIANMIATPYGSEDPRRRDRRRKALGLLDKIGTKEEQAAAASRAAATPSVVKRSVPAVTSSPSPRLRPEAPVGKTMDQAVGGAQYPSMYRSMDSVVGGMGVPAAPVGRTMDQAVGGAQYPSMYRSMDSRVGLLQQAQGSPNPRGNTPLRNAGAVQGMSGNFAYPKFSGNDASSQMDRYLPASMNMGQTSTMPQPNMPSPETFSANAPSAAAMTSATPAPADRNSRLQAFNAAMATVPQMLQGTEIAGMYRDHLLSGGIGTFAQFTGAR